MPGTEAEKHAVAPTPATERIRGLDALRGIALLGILWANVRQLLQPWDIGNFPVSLEGSDRLAWLDWQLFDALIDLKFITLFSLLFGIGFALQGERLTARGSRFNALYLRRVSILAAFGVAHGVLLYPAEVLLPYALAALLLLAAQRVSAENLIRTGLVLLGITMLWGYQIGSIGRIHIGITLLTLAMLICTVLLSRKSWPLALWTSTAVVVAAACTITWAFDSNTMAASIAHEYQSAQRQLAAMISGPSSEWPEEFRVRREGGLAALIGLHAQQYAAVLFYFAIMLLWRTLGLFMIGAGIFRSGVLARATTRTWQRVAMIGISIGLPLSIVATWLQAREVRGQLDWRWPEFLHALSALPLAAGIAGAVFILYRSSALVWLWTRIEAAGRMALTNYVGQSLVMAAIAEPWGLSMYGRLAGPQLTLLAILVFATLAILSELWLRRYRMGPLEWLWRCGTYRVWLPNRLLSRDSRESAPEETAAPSRKRGAR